jgi:hypothetical protein
MSTAPRANVATGPVGRALRTPRAAAVAGIAFSVIFTVALLLVRTAVPSDPNDAGRWLTDGSRRGAVLFALGLVPFAGIAFLWFVGVVRDRVGDAEDRFFATVFLGSGLLFVGTLFVASALAMGLVASAGDSAGSLLSSGAWEFGRRTTYELTTVYAMRMAAVLRPRPRRFCCARGWRLGGSSPPATRSRSCSSWLLASRPGSSSRSLPGCSC